VYKRQFESYIDRTLMPAIEAETLAAMKDAEARAKQAPFKDGTGDTRRSIEGGLAGPRAQDTVEGFIRADSVGAGFLESGTAAHVIEPRKSRSRDQAGASTRRGQRALRFEVGGDVVFARRVQHPGTSPVHFITEAMTEDEFGRRINATVERVLDDAPGGDRE
jgi:hypothetical protein